MTSDSFFERLQGQYSDEWPFVAYRKPGKSSVKALLQKNSKLNYSTEFTESGFVFSPFDIDEPAILIPLESSEIIEISSYHYTSEDSKDIFIGPVIDQTLNKEQHIDLIREGLDAIDSGFIDKVVLSRVEKAPLSNNAPLSILQELLSAYPLAFVYLWFHPEVGLWLGATPETLLSVRGKNATTMALAGTQAYKGSLNVDWGAKEQNEQQLVTEEIMRKLKTCTSDIKTSETSTVKAGNLLHLQTMITAKLKDNDLSRILNELHPTPAICGLPRNKAMEFIRSYENYDREFYTGFLGELNFKEHKQRNGRKSNLENNAYGSIMTVSSLYVNLRCMQIIGDEIFLYVGG
ncbi:MAG: chorismate-binding protein, partial [Flavobacteriaceae bacterium]|nr:chorismate-binding protein [Bacteroidia bacterium]NNL61833.1 chorismate-binding protein [Flavobacteriaceae bacterium]